MSTQTKTIIVTVIVIASSFLLLRFAGGYFLSTISPDIEISKEQNKNESGKAMVGKDAPYFGLMSYSGGRVDLAGLSGYPVVLTFWSTWNHESSDQIKIFDDYITNNKSYIEKSNIKFVAINSQESRSAVENFVRRGGYELSVLMDENGETSNNYGVKTLPTTFFINQNGSISEIFVGTMSERMLVDKIEQILR